MRLPSVPSQALVDHLNSVYFGELWNSADEHGRRNLQIFKVGPRLQIGTFSTGLSVVGLPTAGTAYAVYQASYSSFGRFVNLPVNTWTTDSNLVSSIGVSTNVYTASGRLCPIGSVNLLYDVINSTVYIAIPATYISACTGNVYPDLYMTVNLDTTRNTPVVSSVFTVSSVVGSTSTSTLVNQAIASAKATYPNGTMIVVNGYIYDPQYVPTLNNGDVVNIISDPDIIGYCDITVDDNQTGYYSNAYGEYREILHIPKSLNPENTIITNDTITTVMFNPSNNQGLYGLRIDPHAIESITHNDFSISRSIIQAYQNSLTAQTIVVRVYIRFATKPIYLTDDVNHISDLYSLTDSSIMQQLIGQATNQILEWKAANLEQSAFISLLYNFPGYNSTQILNQYITAMGYYNVASVLGQCMRYYQYKGAQNEIFKPVRLYGIQCNAIVYSNGRKVPDSLVQISDYKDSSFLLGFDSSAYVSIGSNIALYIVENDYRAPVPFAPSQGNPSIILNNEDYDVYKISTYSNHLTVWNGTSNAGYLKVAGNQLDYVITANNDGTYTYTFQPVHYGQSFYLTPKYGMTTSEYNLDATLTAKQAILLPLSTTDINNTVIPLFDYTTLEIYLNGYKLIEDIDYTLTQTLGPDNGVVQTLLTISNADYLNLTSTGNTLEVVSHGDVVASHDSGFSISNTMYRKNIPTFWSRSTGRVYAHGLLMPNVSDSGNTLISADTIVDGSVYSLEYCIPYGVQKLLAGFSPNVDTSLKTRIDRVLGVISPTYPSTIVVSHLYALYSPYLTQIIADVGSGALVIRDEAKDDDFLRQFTGYNLLYNADPIIGTSNTLIDRRFMTLAADYANWAVSDPTQMILTQRLINLLLTPSQLSINEVLV